MINSKQTFRLVGRLIKGMCLGLMISLVTFSSCADDDIDRNRPITPPNPDISDAEVVFEINMPQTMIPSTYALTATDENHVKSIEILLFDSGTKIFTGKPYYCDKIENIAGENLKKKYFSVSLPKGGPYDIVILANSRQMVNDALVAATPTETLKDKVLGLLKMEHTGKWISDASDGNYKPIPMWGEVAGGKTIVENLKFNAQLMRMLAKIDVAIDAGAQSLFKLTAVHLVKANTEGHIVPAVGNLGGGKATAPTLVEASSTSDVVLTYPVPSGATELKSTIYTFEAIKAAAGSLTAATCVVLQGEFNGDGNIENYYRLDFGSRAADGSVGYLDLLRNFRYDIKITKISGTGQGSIGDAIKYPSTNIVTDITVWNNGEFPIIVFDNTYSLGLSTEDIVLDYQISVDNILKLKTDYPGGWVINPTIEYETGSGSDWLTITTPLYGPMGDTGVTKFNLKKNEGATSRICYISVSAGPLKHKVKVTQTPMVQIGKVVWDDYDGTNSGGTNDNDVNFTSITIVDTEDNSHTHTGAPVRDINPVIKVEGDIKEVTAVYKGYTLLLPAGSYEIDEVNQTLIIKDRTLIGKPVHLHKIRLGMSGKYIQVSDVDIASDPDLAYTNWEPIGSNTDPFKGNYDGGSLGGNTGFVIKSLNIDRITTDYVGLFGYVDGGTFKNMHIASGEIKGKNYVGGIFGFSDAAVISGCSNAATVETHKNYAGGIAGSNTGTLTNCTNTATVTGVATGANPGALSTYLGGICGANSGTITGVVGTTTNTGNVESLGRYLGGICGINSGSIYDCSNAATISSTHNYGDSVGGIVGLNSYSVGVAGIVNCQNLSTAWITGIGAIVGGIAGNNYSAITNCTNAGTVSGSNNIGGIAGSNRTSNGIITGVDGVTTNTGDITGTNSIGGISGGAYEEALIEVCSNSGTVEARTIYLGGICGIINSGACVKLSTNTGVVKGGSYTGGIVGTINNDVATVISQVTGCHNKTGGNVTGTVNYIGGVVGVSYGVIEGCTNAATVTGTEVTSSYLGGICGSSAANTKITNSHNLETGTVKGKVGAGNGSNFGGICGINFGAISGCSNKASVTGEAGATLIGGIVGNSRLGSVSACYNIGGMIAPVGTQKLGAIIGEGVVPTDCYFGGDADGMAEAAPGVLRFSGTQWPSGGVTGNWSLYDASTNPNGYWSSLGGWNNGVGTEVYPSPRP